MSKEKVRVIADKPAYKEYLTTNKVTINEIIEDNMDKVDAIRYVEKHYPEMTNEFKKIQQEQYELFCNKQYNYGKGNIMLGGDVDKTEDRKMAMSGIVIRMNDKLNRLMNLVLKSRKDVVDESVEDTFIDMANYSIIAMLVNRLKWK